MDVLALGGDTAQSLGLPVRRCRLALLTIAAALAGAAVSLTGMILLKKTGLFSPLAVSVTGGVLHNVGQIAAACLWTGNVLVVSYFPVLLFSGIAAGAVIGLAAGLLLNRLRKVGV